jgi:hypothetical protein
VSHRALFHERARGRHLSNRSDPVPLRMVPAGGGILEHPEPFGDSGTAQSSKGTFAVAPIAADEVVFGWGGTVFTKEGIRAGPARSRPSTRGSTSPASSTQTRTQPTSPCCGRHSFSTDRPITGNRLPDFPLDRVGCVLEDRRRGVVEHGKGLGTSVTVADVRDTLRSTEAVFSTAEREVSDLVPEITETIAQRVPIPSALSPS